MSSGDVKKILEIILCGKKNYCALCLSIVEEKDAYEIEDEVILNSDGEAIKMQLYEILNIVLHKVSSYIEGYVCGPCAQTVLNTYTFISMCETNIKKIYSAVDNLNSAVDFTTNLTSKSLCISFDVDTLSCINYYYNQRISDTQSALRLLGEGDFTNLSQISANIKEDVDDITDYHIEDDEYKYEVNFDSDVHLNNTLHDNYGNKSFKCRICLTEQDNEMKLKQHFLKFHASHDFKCQKCPRSFSDMKQLKSHISGSHIPATCKICGEKFPNKSRMKYHTVKVHKIGDKLKCPQCEKKFKSHVGFLQHYERCLLKHQLKPEKISKYGYSCKGYFQCKYCEVCKSTADSLKKHYIAAHAPKTYKCDMCPKKFGSQSVLDIHSKRSHCTDPACTGCEKTCLSRIKENELNPFKTCPHCGKSYKTKKAYRQHVDNLLCLEGGFERARQYICDFCGKTSQTRGAMTHHIRYVHLQNIKLHECKCCEKKFSSKSQLDSHMLTHTKVKNFICDICGGKFVTKASLLYHTRIHTGEKPYQCKLCDRTFLSASRRADHVRRNHMEPSLPCKMCPKRFKNYSSLKRHRLRHSNPNSSLYIIPKET